MIDKSDIDTYINDHLDDFSSMKTSDFIYQCFADLQPQCKSCKHWTRTKESDCYLPEDEAGVCAGLTSSRIDIELKTGWDGGYIDTIETNHDFLCANFESKPEPPK